MLSAFSLRCASVHVYAPTKIVSDSVNVLVGAGLPCVSKDLCCLSISLRPLNQCPSVQIMRNQLQTALQGQTLTVEQLAVISMSLANPEGLLSPSAPPQSVANLEQTRAQNESGS